MRTWKRAGMAAAVVLMVLTMSLQAHEMTLRGTVLAIESARLQVNTVDEKTRRETAQWFNVTRQTRTRRGDTIVRYEDAMIAKGERVVVLVDHESDTKILLLEIRLAAK